MTKKFPALIHKEKGSDYGVSFPDIPGCVTAGSSPEEAYKLAEEVLQFHIDGMLEEGESIPEPSLDNADKLARATGASIIHMVPVRLPSKAKRVNITIDENILEDIDQAAAIRGVTRSAFLVFSARNLIDKKSGK
jgi:predicted RNase H-like HicB family nuclease